MPSDRDKDKTPVKPFDADNIPREDKAELAVLGSLLLERDAIIKVVDFLKPDDFMSENNKQVYAAILAMYERREPSDAITLGAELERVGKLAQIGGYSFLTGLVNRTPTSVHIEHYAHLVERAARMRGLITVGGHIAALGYSDEKDPSVVLAQANGMLMELAQRASGQGYKTMPQAMNEYADRWEFLLNNRGGGVGVPTGFTDLDDLTGGLQKGELYLLAARPGVGKTALAMNIGMNATMHISQREDGSTYRVGILSLEMSLLQLITRLLSTMTGLDGSALRESQYLKPEQIGLVQSAIGRLAELGMLIDDTPYVTISSLRATAHRMNAEHGIDLLIVDYGQLLHGTPSKDNNPRIEQTEISRGLKLLARELNIPVLVLCQLSRAVESRPGQKPQLSDLRESGSWEQDADTVFFLHQQEDEKQVDLLVAKHRNGAVGTVHLYFNRRTTEFRNMTERSVFGGNSEPRQEWQRQDEVPDIDFSAAG